MTSAAARRMDHSVTPALSETADRLMAQVAYFPLDQMLAAAERSVETRFLEGGVCLTGLTAVLDPLIGSIEHLRRTVGEVQAAGTTRILRDALSALATHQRIDQNQSAVMADLTVVCAAMQQQAADLGETMRYLRTFAMTAKIAGAGVSEFTPFAQEIMEQIAVGTREVEELDRLIRELREDLQTADRQLVRGEQADMQGFSALMQHLQAGLNRIDSYHGDIEQVAARVTLAADKTRHCLVTGLTAMQIGDMTRQRLEHIRAILSFGDTAQDPRHASLATHLAAAQLKDVIARLKSESATVLSAIRSATRETSAILAAGEQLESRTSGSDDSFYAALDTHLQDAAGLLARLDQSRRQHDAVATRGASSTLRLLDGMAKVRAIRTDIFYMALNTNLRCSRLGETGRAINVVTTELRAFAAHLEDTVEAMAGHLEHLRSAADTLAFDAGAAPDLGAADIEGATAIVHAKRLQMEGDLSSLFGKGRDAHARAEAAVLALDMDAELVGMLETCLEQLQEKGRGAPRPVASDTDIAALQPLLLLYTMECERQIHETVLPGSLTSFTAEEAAAGLLPDDDLFASALF